jgi:Cdc6-like AAA superfamily ATPase
LSLTAYNLAADTQKQVRSTGNAVLGMHGDIEVIGDMIANIYSGAQRQKINDWLSAPDPSTNHRRARSGRSDNTGLWFIDGTAFKEWTENNQLMWLYGKAGCGKTVLSFTIIAEIEHRFGSDGVAYFYFDFNDIEKQKSENMIRSVIKQLFAQTSKKSSQLELSFSSCHKGERQLILDDLLLILKEMIEGYNRTYIILDALDECLERQDLLEVIEQIHEWKLPQLHMLVTSRMLRDIEEVLEPLIEPRNRICIQSAAVDSDIEIYVDYRLRNDRKLRRWIKHAKAQEEIKNTLKGKADGM